VIVTSCNNCLESVFKRSASDKEAVNIGLRNKFRSVCISDTSSVQNSHFVRRFGGNVFLQPSSNNFVSFLCLLWACRLSRADCPDWLVSDYNLAPILNLLADGS